jgi:AraC family transcriptional regulator, positive regulator of tynA and feaB
MSQDASKNLLPPQWDYEAWRHLVRAMAGRFNPEGVDPKAFTGWLRPIDVHGLAAAEVGSNAKRVERSLRDVRLDGADHYIMIFQVAGKSAMTHNDQALRFDSGDVVLVDAARPVAFFNREPDKRWGSLTLVLPRRSLVSHLGFEPRGGLCRRGGTAAGRLLLDLIRSFGREEPASTLADSYMRLAAYDLVGALFAPTDLTSSRHADKLFRRVRAVITDGFADPNFGPCEAAAVVGISLRYLQQLFTHRGSTCSEFIYSLRLDHAKRLLLRRAALSTGQPLSEVAYACGFRNYAHFARKFRQRFGHAPGAYPEADGIAGNEAVNARSSAEAS